MFAFNQHAYELKHSHLYTQGLNVYMENRSALSHWCYGNACKNNPLWQHVSLPVLFPMTREDIAACNHKPCQVIQRVRSGTNTIFQVSKTCLVPSPSWTSSLKESLIRTLSKFIHDNVICRGLVNLPSRGPIMDPNCNGTLHQLGRVVALKRANGAAIANFIHVNVIYCLAFWDPSLQQWHSLCEYCVRQLWGIWCWSHWIKSILSLR